jgi:DNA uptake protein ComE-like DNA-binding protein
MNKILPRLLALCFAATLLAAPAVILAQSAPAPTPAKANEKKAKGPAKVDLNTATKEQLAKLPGFDEATADKIIAARPFASKTQLKSKKLVSDETYESVKNLVVASRPKSPDAPKKEGKRKAG